MVASKTFFYVLTIQGQWEGVPNRQLTLNGTITTNGAETRERLFDTLHAEAEKMWWMRVQPGEMADSFNVIAFSIESNEL